MVDILLIILLLYCSFIFLKSLVVVEVGSKNYDKCPPHSWEYVENLKMRNKEVYTGLYCSRCKKIPNYVGRE